MTQRPLRSCSVPYCPSSVHAKGKCRTHARAREQKRGSAASRGYDKRHQEWADRVLRENPLCGGCGAAPHRGDHADHIVPLPRPNWWDGDWSLKNGQRLCRPCHSRKTLREQRA